MDCITVLVGGIVTESGSYEELLSHDGDFAQFLKQYLVQDAAESDAEDEEEESEWLCAYW